MLAIGVMWLQLSGALAPAPDFAGARRDSARQSHAIATAARATDDTVRRRPKVVDVSDWYSRRLTIHRYAAYSIIPVFGVQYVAGTQLWDHERDAPTWAKTTHRIGATTLAGLFTVNTVTGLWNLWDSRSVTQGRALRYVHALTMLTADAGFTYAGAKLSNDAETDADARSLHRTIALSSMGLTVASGLIMHFFNR
jgi:hypothetical protein